MRRYALFALCAAATALSFSGISGLVKAQAPASKGPIAPGPATQGKDAAVLESRGVPPRAAPSDYRAQARAGALAIAADFTGHNVSSQEGTLTTEEYVVIEAAIFGPPEARLMLSMDNFSLSVNGKKAVPVQPYALVAKSLKDPDYEPPAPTQTGSKTKYVGTGKPEASPDDLPPAPISVPFEVKRSWEQRIKRDSLPLGDRALPQAGLLFFPYSGGAKSIRSIELIYNGPGGKATVLIHP